MNRRHFLAGLAGSAAAALTLLSPLAAGVTARPAPVLPPLRPLTREQRNTVARLRRAVTRQHGAAVWRRYRVVVTDWCRMPEMARVHKASGPAACALLLGLFEETRTECGSKLFPFQLSNGAVVRVDGAA